MTTELQELYRTRPRDVRPSYTAESARESFGRYVSFIREVFAPPGRLLDVGVGDGWSSELLAREGYEVTGLDLNREAFQVAEHPGLRLVQGSMLELPFEDGAFDVVTTYQALEHSPEPERSLREMARVLRPGGVLCVVGPNLLSPVQSLKAVGLYSWRNRPLNRILFRDAEMPRHPFGNTLPEATWMMANNLVRLARKLASPEPTFDMRDPDVRPPFHGDNDACYLCNPVDLTRFLEREGFRVLKRAPGSRPESLALLAGGTWVAGRKG